MKPALHVRCRPSKALRAALLLALCGLFSACSVNPPANASSGSGASGGVTMREVVGDFCPPAQATKGNC
jgi:hypothetical protein